MTARPTTRRRSASSFADARLRVIRHPHNRGVAAGPQHRRRGGGRRVGACSASDCASRSTMRWCSVARPSATARISSVRRCCTSTASMPMPAELAARAPRRALATVDRRVGQCSRSGRADTVPAVSGARPSRGLRPCPLFFEGFPVNGYRKEADFFVQAATVGFHCPADPRDLLLSAEHVGRWSTPFLAVALRVSGAGTTTGASCIVMDRALNHRATSTGSQAPKSGSRCAGP